MYTGEGDAVTFQDSLINRVQSLYKYDPSRGDPPLHGTEHSWPFSIRINQNASLPPVFELLNAPGGKCIAWIRYTLRVAVIGSDMHTEKFNAQKGLYYCPLRMTSLPNGPLPVAHLRPMLITASKKPVVTAERPSRHRLSSLFSSSSTPKTPKEEVQLGIHLPRYIILQDPVLAHLTLQRRGQPEIPAPEVALNEICYTLSNCVIMRGNKGVRKNRKTLHIYRTVDLQIPFIDGRCDLTGDAGYTLKPSHEPSGTSQASVCPSFWNDRLSATYELAVQVKWSYAGQQVFLNSAVQDVILLPKDPHPSVKEKLPEADDAARVLPNEAGPTAVVHEMEVPPNELEEQYGHEAPGLVPSEVEEAATRRPELAPGAVDLQRQPAVQRVIERKPLHIGEEVA